MTKAARRRRRGCQWNRGRFRFKFRRSKGVTEVEALRERKKIPEHIRKLLLANVFCHNCGTTEFAPGYTLRMRHGRVLAEGCRTECGAEVARYSATPII